MTIYHYVVTVDDDGTIALDNMTASAYLRDGEIWGVDDQPRWSHVDSATLPEWERRQNILRALLDPNTFDVCIWCGLEVFDGGDFLRSVGEPLAVAPECRSWASTPSTLPRGHCTGFAPDTLGDDPDVCTSCLAHRSDHPVTNEGESTEDTGAPRSMAAHRAVIEHHFSYGWDVVSYHPDLTDAALELNIHIAASMGALEAGHLDDFDPAEWRISIVAAPTSTTD